MKRKIFQLVKDENRMVVRFLKNDFNRYVFIRTLCITAMLKLQPLFIYMYMFIYICICRFKNDIFPVVCTRFIKINK